MLKVKIFLIALLLWAIPMVSPAQWFDTLQSPADVDKTAPTDGQVLQWDDTYKLWKPATVTAAETDPIVKAINGIVKSNGSTISAALDGTDFLAPSRIDDTKGNGDTTYIYSADKVYDQLALKSNLISPAFTTPNIGAATATSIAIGANILDTNEWAYLDGQDQAVKSISNVFFNKINLRDSAIGIYSQADTFLDLFADGGIRIGDSAAGAPANYAKFSGTGDLTLNGSADYLVDLSKYVFRYVGDEDVGMVITSTDGVSISIVDSAMAEAIKMGVVSGTNSGNLTAIGTISGEQLTSTDDADIADKLTVNHLGEHTASHNIVLDNNVDVSTKNIITDTSTGTKIGTATTQKLGFYNSTPIVQPAGNIKTALSNLGLVGSPTVTADTNANLSGMAVSSGNTVSTVGINRAAGITPTQTGFTTAPTNLANATDGNWSTSTGIGINTTVTAWSPADGGIKFNLGAIYNMQVRGLATIGNTNAAGGNVMLRIYASMDDSTWYEVGGDNMGVMIWYCENNTKASYFSGFCRARYLVFVAVNFSDTTTNIKLGLTEVQAIDMGL